MRKYQRKTRVHAYCGGRGWITLASGATAQCCNNGRIELVSREEREEMRKYGEAHSALAFLGNGIKAPADLTGMARVNFRSEVIRGLELLADKEPERLERLYASLADGRLQDVAAALYRYANPPQIETGYCRKCHRDGLMMSALCDRGTREDLGADRRADIVSRYEGYCVRCCGHNHA